MTRAYGRIALGLGLGIAIAGLITGSPTAFGIGIAAAAAGSLVLWTLQEIRLAQAEQRRRQYRDEVWQRRIAEAGGIRGGRDPRWLHEISDDQFGELRATWGQNGAPE